MQTYLDGVLTNVIEAAKTPAQIAQEFADAKVAKYSEIDAAREAANRSSFVYLGVIIACDPLSRSDLDATANTIAMTGALPVGWPGGWKGKNEQGETQWLPIATPDEFKALYASMVAQGVANLMRSEQCKALIENAQTIEDVQRVTW